MDLNLNNMTSVYLYNDKDEILMLYRVGSRVVKNSYIGSAGGHFEKEELNDPRACVLRELFEETGLTEQDIENLALRYVTLRLKKTEIRQNYYYFAKVKTDREIKSNEGNLKWFGYDEALELDMPHTAKYVVTHFVKTGRKNNKLYGGIAVPSGVKFTELENF